MSVTEKADTFPEFPSTDIHIQLAEWRKKGWSIPDIQGGKQSWFPLVKELTALLKDGQAYNLDSIPNLSSVPKPVSWRSYAPFLKGIGLVRNQAGTLVLSDDGERFLADPSKQNLADQIQNRVRLFAEVLYLLSFSSETVESANERLCRAYQLTWKNLSNTRRRLDWLEVLGLIQNVGYRKFGITDDGKKTLDRWILVSPDILENQTSDSTNFTIPDPPPEIAALLQRLVDSPELHKKRYTYNIWVPSPNRIDNLRIITQAASECISKSDFFSFIEEKFNLKASSVDTILPFLKASGLIEEVGRYTYQATPPAKAWLKTGNDLDFIRILHANMQFVGEMIRVAEKDTIRSDIYSRAKSFGLNAEKARWIAGFLLEAGLLEETQYLHLKATPMGNSFVTTLPLSEIANVADKQKVEPALISEPTLPQDGELDRIANRLRNSSHDPSAEGRAPGTAFELAIAEIFQYMGFDTNRIGGPGDTDVVVRWQDQSGKIVTAIIDGKSKSSGFVSHSDISDIAIDTHKEKNHADFVAVIGPGFSGETIRSHAKKKAIALITDEQIIEIARSAHSLGLSLQEIALAFLVPSGLSSLDELISSKQRNAEIISSVISNLFQERQLTGGLSPRDLYFLLRNTDLSPSITELINAFNLLSQPEIGILKPSDNSRPTDILPENIVYQLNDAKNGVNRLRGLALAVENGLKNAELR